MTSQAATSANGGEAARDAKLWLPLRFALRELRSGIAGFRIFLACLLLGVAAIAAVGSVSKAMLDGLRQDGRRILGGDIELRLTHRQITEEQLRFISRYGDVSAVAHMRAMARPDGGTKRRVLVELKSVDQLYPLFGEVVLDPPLPLNKALARQDNAWGAAVDAALLRRFGIEPGDSVTIGDATFRIAAVLELEPDRAARAFVLGPTFIVSGDALAATGLVQPGSLIGYHYRVRLANPDAAAAFRQDLDATFPDGGWRLTDSNRAAPRIDQFIKRLTLFLTLIGLTSLLIGGVGVGNAVRSYLEGRTATIATLKCLGAPSSLVFQIYMVQILLLSLLGIGGGLAVGALSPWLVNQMVGNALGWSAAIGLYPKALLLAAAFGVLITITFSLWPLGRARTVPPAQLYRDLIAPGDSRIDRVTLASIAVLGLALAILAIVTARDPWLAFYFVLGVIGSFLLFRLAGEAVVHLARRFSRVRSPTLRLAVANLQRPGAPTVPVVMSLGLGLTLLVAIALIEGNLSQQVTQALPEEAPAFYFIDIQPQQIEPFEATVRAIDGVTEVAQVPTLRGRIVAVNDVPPEDLEIPSDIQWVFSGDRGLTWRRDPVPDAELAAGEWWPPDYSGDPLVSLDADVGRALGIGPGDRLSVNILGRNFEVEIANLREIDWSNLGINFVMVFSPGLLETAPQTHIATVKVDAASEDAVEIAVTDQFANISAIRVRDALDQVGELMGHIAVAVRGIAAVAILAGILVLAGAVAAGHRRRVYDAVVLKVLGATRRRLGQSFLLEYGLLGLVTAIIAAIIGSLAAFLVLTEVMGTPFVFLPWAVISTVVLATAITLAFGFLGTFHALGQKAAPLLRNE